MQLLSKISLRAKLLILVLLPFLVLGYFTFDKVKTEQKEISSLASIRTKVAEIGYFAGVIHEFQKERDYSVKFLLNPIMDNHLELDGQIHESDSLINILKREYRASKRDTSIFMLFSGLNKTRADVSYFALSIEEIKDYYNSVVDRFMDEIAQTGADAKTPQTKEAMKSYIALLRTKESLGKIRSDVGEAFVYYSFQGLGYGNFSAHKGAFESSLRLFMNYSPDEIKSKFEMEFQGGSILNTLEMINYCFEHPNDRLVDFTSDYWWINVTTTMNILYEQEMAIVNNIQARLEAQEAELQSEIDQTYALLSGVLTVLLILVSLVARNITSDLSAIKSAADSVKLGKTDVAVPVRSQDEIGKLAQTFNDLVSNSKNLSSIAEQIGNGDYNVEFEPRSEEDTLGLAIQSMRSNLKSSREELKQQYDKLKSAFQYKSEFLANMSHELRTPLNSMLILSKVLSENEHGNLNGEQIESLQVIHRSGANLLELINDILDLSKVEAGKLTVEQVTTDLGIVLGDLQALFTPVAKENKLAFALVVEEDIPQIITSDPLRLAQILRNLLSNAMKFTPSGGKVSLVVSKQQETLNFSVIDTGIGIPFNKQQAIFEAFNQADGSTSRNYGGTGLGLSISSEFAHLLGGKITLESEQGKGSKFTLEHPLLAENSELLQLDNHEVKAIGISNNESSVPEQKPAVSNPVANKSNDNNLTPAVKATFKGKNILLITEDISEVFEFSAKVAPLQAMVTEVTDVSELEEKVKGKLDLVLWVKSGFSTEENDQIVELLQPQQHKVLEIGNSETIEGILDLKGIHDWVQKANL